MAQNETWLKHDLLDAVKVQYLDGNLFSMDNAGNLIGVTLTRDGEDYSGGGSVSANVIRSDGRTVAVSGALSEKTATVVLPQAAYAVPGVVSIVVKLTASGQVTTIAALVANVYRSSTDTAIDPGTIIPSIQSLISQINTAVASIPADYSALWTKLAPAFSPDSSYVAGQYVTHNSGLWRFNTSHSGSWSSSDVTAVNLGGEISDLKSAINNVNNWFADETGVHHYLFTKGGWIPTTTTAVDPTDVVSNDAKAYCVISCQAGDKFYFKGSGVNSTHRPWSFIDSSNAVKSQATSNTVDETITAPVDATKLVLNVDISNEYFCVKNNSRITALENTVANNYENLSNWIENVENGDITQAETANNNVYVNPNNGSISSTGSTYSSTVRILIPAGCTRIEFDSVDFNNNDDAGWAIYSQATGSATTFFVRGGRTKYIDVQDGDVAFAVCTYYQGTAPESISVHYSFGEVVARLTKLEHEANSFPWEIESVSATNGVYVNSETGAVSSTTGKYVSSVRFHIPEKCTKIVFPDILFNFAGKAGWAVYERTTGSATTYFIRGGQTNYIDVQNGDVAFAVSTAYTGDNAPNTIRIQYVYDGGKDIYDAEYPVNNKIIAFVGDSVTFGLDDDNSPAQLPDPWAKQVSVITKALTYNEGVSSSSLMDGVTGGGNPTPKAWALEYDDLPNNYDIIGTMIGINDCYRDYTLGQFTDRTADSFYGALHVYMTGMQNKYPAENGKHLFMMIYPHYDKKNTYDTFMNAIVEVARYYSIPVLDLRYECGISQYNDTQYKYWRQAGNGHSAHLTQLGANVVAPVIANYIEERFR